MKPFPRLILVEGLPGSGKSTTAQQIWLHLESLGRPARWWYEHEMGHPIFDDAQVRTARETGMAEPHRIFEHALAGWAALAASLEAEAPPAVASAKAGTVILESTLFQTTIGSQLLMDLPRAEIEAHFERTAGIIAPLAPALISLHRPDAEAALRDACARRPGWFEEFIRGQFAATPLGRRLGRSDFPAVVGYFRERQAVAEAMAGRFPGLVLVHDNSDGDWARQRRAVAGFLGLDPAFAEATAGGAREAAVLGDYTGRFRADTGDEWNLAADARGLYFADEARTRLLPHGRDAFVIEGLSVELIFHRNGGGAVREIACRGALPGLAASWSRM